jgi:diguanylate cyclase (GGDEF)-like protein/PAS domain S-box-containing protein
MSAANILREAANHRFCLLLVAQLNRFTFRRKRQAKPASENFSEAIMTLAYIVDVPCQTLVYCNRFGSNLIGITKQDLSHGGTSVLHRFADRDDAVTTANHFAHLAEIQDGEVVEFEQKIMGADGAWHLILHRECICTRDLDGSSRTVVGIGHDITEKRREHELLAQSKDVFEHMIEKAGVGIALVSPAGSFLRVNEFLCEFLGYSKTELLGLDVQFVTHPDDIHIDQILWTQILAGLIRTCHFEKRFLRKDGKPVWIYLHITLVRDLNDSPLHFISQISDISELKEQQLWLQKNAIELDSERQKLAAANERLKSMAATDGLTGLANRRQFDEEFAHLFSSAKRYRTSLSVIVVDIDHFKRVNDNFGHQEGDRVISEVARLLRKGARDSDIVARYGGEEFAVICPHTDLASATFLAKRLCRAVANFQFDHGAITASFGVASLATGDHDVQDLLSRADGALYQSKALGRNQVSIWKPKTLMAA